MSRNTLFVAAVVFSTVGGCDPGHPPATGSVDLSASPSESTGPDSREKRPAPVPSVAASPLTIPKATGALQLAAYVQHVARKDPNKPTAAELDREGHRAGSIRFTPLGEVVGLQFSAGALVGTIDRSGGVTDGAAFRRGLPSGDTILLHGTSTSKGPVVYYGPVVHDPTKPQPIAPFRREASGWVSLGSNFGKDTAHLMQLLPWHDGAIGVFDSQSAMAEIAQGIDFNAPARTWFAVVPKTTSATEPPPWEGARVKVVADASSETLYVVGRTDRDPALTLRTMTAAATGAPKVVDTPLPIPGKCLDIRGEGLTVVAGAAGEVWIVASAGSAGAECDANRTDVVLVAKGAAKAAKVVLADDERLEKFAVDGEGNLFVGSHAKRVVRIGRDLAVSEIVAPRPHKDGTHAYAWIDGGNAVWLVEDGKMIRRASDGKVTAWSVPEVVAKGSALSADAKGSPKDCRFGDATFVAGEGFFGATCFMPGACEYGCEVVFRSGDSKAGPAVLD